MEATLLTVRGAAEQSVKCPEDEALIWMRHCAICGRVLTKASATDTVCCKCGEFIWNG
jgi:phage FluMu protein Com